MESFELRSTNYVPGVSGMRIDCNTGTIEINSGNYAVGSLPADPQVVIVTAAEWQESDVPVNAKERLAFLGGQLDKVPAEFRADAELSTEDISFDRDGSDIRTTLTYRRLESVEEAAERVTRLDGSSMTIKSDGSTTIVRNGVVVARIGSWKEEPPAVGLRIQEDAGGKFYAAGLGVGVSAEQAKSDADAPLGKAVDAGKVLDYISGQISETSMAEGLRAFAASKDAVLAVRVGRLVKQVLRDELKPGGILHRH